ncbi:NYN domain-containing protein [Nocardiopsis sp. EMB25]|uniref:NYN domain-containing protein n=1 Tax=Nocardiopsis sp. EMB25 TaxID=2835867 RepID=UPI00228484B5|nr:NYN domain-containing protein [Nocardiopsis sp. EMB25]MCY9786897.1 NYN domain-containing protein [Nocardiopsis sp. EMB25]
MDRCALFVDAGYLLADGAMAVHGTRNRDSVSWDYSGLVQFLNEVARDRTGLPLLRCYWYEAVADDRRTQEQDGIADIPGIKFRAARIRPGRREGVESYVQRDLTTLARTGVLCDAVLVSGDEDMASVVADVQDLGVRVTVVHISVEGNWTISRTLRRECDDLIEIGAGHLRPHVNLLTSGGSSQENAAKTTTPFANGRARSAPETPRQPVEAQPGGSRVEPAGTTGGGLEGIFAGTGPQPVPQGSAMEQLRAMRRSLAQQRGDHLAGPATDTRQPGPIDANGFPSGAQTPMNGNGAYPGTTPSPTGPGGQNGQGVYPPGDQPVRGAEQNGYGLSGRPASPQPGANTHAAAGPQPAFTAGTGPQQSFAGGTGSQQSFAGAADAQQPFAGGTGPQQSFAGGTGPQRSFASDNPQGHPPPQRSGPPPQADPRFGPGDNAGFGGANDANPTYGTSTETDAARRGGAAPGYGGPPRTGPEHDERFDPRGHQEPGSSPGYPQQTRAAAHTVDDAVHVARKEGNDFAESIAREAPALWVEAVLARRPRMPSDLEARLLQGSSLPIDHLLRDEVRDGLRQGFWQALERARP